MEKQYRLNEATGQVEILRPYRYVFLTPTTTRTMADKFAAILAGEIQGWDFGSEKDAVAEGASSPFYCVVAEKDVADPEEARADGRRIHCRVQEMTRCYMGIVPEYRDHPAVFDLELRKLREDRA